MEHQGLEQVMVALNQYGFGPQISMRIYQAYKEETLSIIQKILISWLRTLRESVLDGRTSSAISWGFPAATLTASKQPVFTL